MYLYKRFSVNRCLQKYLGYFFSMMHRLKQRPLAREARYPASIDTINTFIRDNKNSKMKLTDNVMQNFRVAKIFRENTERITSVDYSANGDTLITSSDDDSIVIYDCQNGT